MQFNSAQREIAIKVVYYGPPLSGKTTNLQAIHRVLDPKSCGKLTVLDTADDRTLFFDLLPVTTRLASGYTIKLKLFTVPGQVIHAATRRLVLAGADGVVFVADSQNALARANNEYWHGMRSYMKDNGLEPDKLPTVIQFNKRDLPNIRTDAELDQVRKRGREPVYTAVAVRGEGVLETLRGVLELVFRDLNQRYEFDQKFGFSAGAYFASIFSAAASHVAGSPQPPGAPR